MGKKGEGEDEAVRTRERDRRNAKEPLLASPFTKAAAQQRIAQQIGFASSSCQLPVLVTMMMESWARAGLGLGWPIRCYSSKGVTVASPHAELWRQA